MDDAQLAAAVLRGDREAESLFFSKLKDRIQKAGVYFLGYQDPDVEDVVQETFLIAFSKLKEYDPRKASLYTWMAHICVNLCYERLRKRKRDMLAAQEELETACRWLAQKRQNLLEEDNEKATLIGIVKEKMKELGEECRKILELRDIQGTSYIDIARTVRVPIGTVMSRLARCRASLRKIVLSEMQDSFNE